MIISLDFDLNIIDYFDPTIEVGQDADVILHEGQFKLVSDATDYDGPFISTISITQEVFDFFNEN